MRSHTPRGPAAAIALVLLAACLPLPSCRERREDPFEAMGRKYALGKHRSLAEYYRAAEGIGLSLKGIVMDVPADKASALMDAIHRDYSAAMPFVIEKNYGKEGKPDKVAVVASMDKFALVSALRTGGRKDAARTGEVVKALRAIDARAKIVITGAGRDFVQFTFLDEPRDWAALARLCAEAAPNILAYGAENLAQLEKEMRQLRGAILWWY